MPQLQPHRQGHLRLCAFGHGTMRAITELSSTGKTMQRQTKKMANRPKKTKTRTSLKMPPRTWRTRTARLRSSRMRPLPLRTTLRRRTLSHRLSVRPKRAKVMRNSSTLSAPGTTLLTLSTSSLSESQNQSNRISSGTIAQHCSIPVHIVRTLL